MTKKLIFIILFILDIFGNQAYTDNIDDYFNGDIYSPEYIKKEYDLADEICNGKKNNDVPIPEDDHPNEIDRKNNINNCDYSYKYYYGIGLNKDYIKARQCA